MLLTKLAKYLDNLVQILKFPFQFRENYTFSTQHFESKCITFDFEYLLGSFATIFFNVPSRWHKSTAARTSLYIRE